MVAIQLSLCTPELSMQQLEVPEGQSVGSVALSDERVCQDVCGGGSRGGIRAEELGDQGLGR